MCNLRDCRFAFALLCLLTPARIEGQEIIQFVSSGGRLVYSNLGSLPAELESVGPTEPTKARASSASVASPEIDALIEQIAEQHGVDADLVKAVVKVESNYNVRAVSRKGAHGLMQLLPQTARRFGVTNIFDARQNVEGGVKFLRFLMGLFPGNLQHILAAYNAGENAVLKYRGVPPYPETQAYVKKIAALYGKNTPFLTASNRGDADGGIVRYSDSSGRIVYSNVGPTF
ncbi:MAG: lytic transglycosylase domain-containing protein [Acidobacteriota bacterium]